MSAQHTPGPWHVSEIDATGERSEHYIFIEPGVAIIERKVAGSDDSDMPDARLIASAPDLLNALAAIVGALEATGECHRLAAIGRAAIAKATGSQQ